ncbi:hypothetical protein B0T42_08690 [Rathayibacter sp. VKM Ac-2630]|uniref:SIMPL domain-containing protein n=1 Tax=Rathayibacter sp. VKM Ac-2630 TaxID=1938617 RepID=UPI0009D1F65B|nr:SIMPL domain-containing protein [Rathayibacter sp. VKM Ac-2630]OOB90926.1 hypothetical protein B0T42_08690 [Rathayibacter sp. VKM Ac-2630]
MGPDGRPAGERGARRARGGVRDAQERAAAYASALGLGQPRVLTLFEPGLRPHTSGAGGGYGTMSRAAAFGSQEEPLALKPEDIEIAASISADFEAQ